MAGRFFAGHPGRGTRLCAAAAICAVLSLQAAHAQSQGPAAGAAAQSATASPPAARNAKPDRNPAAKPQSASAAGAPAGRAPIKEPVTSKGCPRIPGKPYFVEFRSRTAASYGHTFVFHGRLGSGRGFASFKVAGLHPKGDDPSTYIQGHWMPVEAETGVSYGDLDEQFLTARFCVVLDEAEYNRAAAYIRHLQGTTKTWHAPTYNCNSFAADIAKHIGLDSPNPNAYLPETFVKRLGESNARRNSAPQSPASGFSMQWGGLGASR